MLFFKVRTPKSVFLPTQGVKQTPQEGHQKRTEGRKIKTKALSERSFVQFY